MNTLLEIKDEVSQALAQGKPVVALESTIISHGMPYPKNLQTALETERIVRECGAVPATCAVIGGKLKAGCSKDEIERLAKGGQKVTKVSRRDLPLICARKMDGATTVAATMIIAKAAGIGVFCTGGIGGVHRGAQESMDISADLQELARTSVMVVCAGAKSILDLGLTLEYLETLGVPLAGFGTDELPAFFTRTSGFKTPLRVDTAAEAAAMFHSMRELGYPGGAVITNPIPEQYSLDPAYINGEIDKALAAAKAAGIHGKETTPFLLAKIDEITGHKSLDANIQLVYNNARVASAIAVELAKLGK
jgi:pseudouridine-5'-phosphate glycosidase